VAMGVGRTRQVETSHVPLIAFDEVVGHSKAKALFRRALQSGRLAHAYLLEGPPGIGKETLAFAVAKALLCTDQPGEGCLGCSACRRADNLLHPDLWYLFPHPSKLGSVQRAELAKQKIQRKRVSYSFPATASIPLSEVRMVQKVANLKPLEGSWKVFVVREADRLTEEASNALLKTLEEPPPRTVMLLTSAASHALLPTVVSRCQRVPMGRLSVDDVATVLKHRLCVKEDAVLWARLAEGSPARAWEIAMDEGSMAARECAAALLESCLDRDRREALRIAEQVAARRDRGFAEAVLQCLLGLCRDAVVLQTSGPQLVQNIDHAELADRVGAARTFAELENASRHVSDACIALRRNANLRIAISTVIPVLRGEQICRS
jgi:DNA polymerase-3 subunit delta'